MSSVLRISARHQRILQLHLLGFKNVDIAERIEMTPQQVSNVINSPSFQYQAAQRREVINEKMDDSMTHNDSEVRSEIKKHTMQAVQRLVNEMDGSVAGDRIRASTELLDRGGFPRVNRTESRSVSVTIDAEQAKIITDTIAMERSNEQA